MFFIREKKKTSNQKSQKGVSFAPKFLHFSACSLQRQCFADIQREKFFFESFSRKQVKNICDIGVEWFRVLMVFTVTSSDCKVKKSRFYEFLFTLG